MVEPMRSTASTVPFAPHVGSGVVETAAAAGIARAPSSPGGERGTQHCTSERRSVPEGTHREFPLDDRGRRTSVERYRPVPGAGSAERADRIGRKAMAEGRTPARFKRRVTP